MANLSTYALNAILNSLFKNIAMASPTTVYVALYTTNPTPNDLGAEVSTSGTGYTRMAVSFTTPSGGSVQNSSLITFPTATDNWGTVSFAALRDASSGGNMLAYGALAVAKDVTDGDIFEFNAGNIFVTAS